MLYKTYDLQPSFFRTEHDNVLVVVLIVVMININKMVFYPKGFPVKVIFCFTCALHNIINLDARNQVFKFII